MSNFRWIRAANRLMAAAVVSLLFAFCAQAQTVRYVHTDGLGSSILVTDKSRNVVERSEYEPYGSLLNRPITDGPGYAGHVMDAVTGLTYMQQRYSDPQIGRFLSVDPVTAYKSPVFSFNPYQFSRNNPYRFSDPDGRQALDQSAKYLAVYEDCASKPGCDPGKVPEKIAEWERPYAEAISMFIPVERVLGGGIKVLGIYRAARLTRLSVTTKLEKYLLNPEHSVGGAKAEWFRQALGYTRENMGELAAQIKFDSSKAVQTGVTEYGTKYNQTIAITGANGRTINVTFAWIRSAKDGVVRLVTAVPTKK